MCFSGHVTENRGSEGVIECLGRGGENVRRAKLERPLIKLTPSCFKTSVSGKQRKWQDVEREKSECRGVS